MVLKSRGRPSRSEQVQIQNVLRTHFERNLSASYTASIAGINIKTVCKYFDEWADQITEAEERDFLKREKKERERIRLSFDSLIVEEYELLEEIKQEIRTYRKENKAVPRYLIATQIEILRTISSLNERKGYFSLQMPMDESVEKMIEAKIKDASTKRRN